MDIWEDIREELRKSITTYEYLNNIGEVIKKYRHFNIDCLSKGQLYSKLWLVEHLGNIIRNLGVVYLYCGWYAIIAEMLFSYFDIEKIKSFDIDFNCESIADEINIRYVMNDWKFKAYTGDVNKVDCSKANTIINLSCEHMSSMEWFYNIPDNRLVVLQSNNFKALDEHINCDESLEEMIDKYKLFKIHYVDALDLNDYIRFMIIGTK